METSEILALLPWRGPFLMIDRMLECTPHGRIVTRKQVTAGDPVSRGAGSTGPWFPSVLLLEGMGQSAALLFRLSYGEQARGELPLLGFLKATLHDSAAPGDAITYHVQSLKMTRGGGVFSAEARVGDAVIAEAELAFAAAADSGGDPKEPPR